MRTLVAEALFERRRRFQASAPERSAIVPPDQGARRKAAYMVERMLSSRALPRCDCSRFLESLATRMYGASGVIDEMLTSIAPFVMSPDQVRALAVAIADIVDFLENCVPPGSTVRFYLAVSHETEGIVVAAAAEGDIRAVGTAQATGVLLRAREIANALGGRLERGVEQGRSIVAITLPGEVAF